MSCLIMSTMKNLWREFSERFDSNIPLTSSVLLSSFSNECSTSNWTWQVEVRGCLLSSLSFNCLVLGRESNFLAFHSEIPRVSQKLICVVCFSVAGCWIVWKWLLLHDFSSLNGWRSNSKKWIKITWTWAHRSWKWLTANMKRSNFCEHTVTIINLEQLTLQSNFNEKKLWQIREMERPELAVGRTPTRKV